MNRREFILTASSTAIVAMLPAPALTAPAPLPVARKLKWFAVGHNDEFCEPILAESMEAACQEYAVYSGHTKGEECPDCGEWECKEHLTQDQWNDPQDCIAENSTQPKAWADLEHEPTGVDWLRAGFHTYCENKGCDTRKQYWETTECWAYNGKALCECCLEVARAADKEQK